MMEGSLLRVARLKRSTLTSTILSTTAVICLVVAAERPASSANVARQLRPTISAEYLEALRIANDFLAAWIARDADAGSRLMSDRLKSDVGDESWLQQYVVGLSNPHHQAFSLGEGQKKGRNRYVFPVTLYELYSGERMGYRYISTLEIVKEGNVWRVGVLPKTSDNQ